MSSGVLLGYLIGLAILSLISALLLKLSAKMILKEWIGFGVCFIISFISFAAALFTQILFDNRERIIP